MSELRGFRGPALIAMALSLCAVGLSIHELTQPRATYLDWPSTNIVGPLVLVGLFAATCWLVFETRGQRAANFWAKAATTLALTLPAMWLYRHHEVWQQLIVLPDADLPAGWIERMNGDILQTQIIALIVTLALFGCVVNSARRRQ